MKVFTLTNKAKFALQLITKGSFGRPGLIYTLKAGKSLEITEEQMSGDVQLKINKKLLSCVEAERDTVKSSFVTAVVEPELEKQPPLSTRGRKKKTL